MIFALTVTGLNALLSAIFVILVMAAMYYIGYQNGKDKNP